MNTVTITISEIELDVSTAIRIMKCLKKHDLKVWSELKSALEKKLPESNVKDIKQ